MTDVEIKSPCYLSKGLEEFTMDDLDKILTWIGDEQIIDDFKFWSFSSKKVGLESATMCLCIKLLRYGGVGIILTESRGWNETLIIERTCMSPEYLRKRARQIISVVERRIRKYNQQEAALQARRNKIMKNFKVEEK